MISTKARSVLPNPFGISFPKTGGIAWDPKDRQAVLDAAARIAKQLWRVQREQARLLSKLEGTTRVRVPKPAQVFRQVMGPVTFERVDGSCGKNCWADVYKWPTV